jgi:putative hydrolase of the HAD superfamily
MRVDAVLFDLDDTLVDWWGSIRRTALDILGDDDTDRLLQWVTANAWTRRDGVVVVRGTWRAHEYAEELWPAALPHLDADDLRLALKRFREDLWVSFFPDAVPVLDTLVDQVPLGVLSNNPYLPLEVERLRLRDWVEATVTPPVELRKPNRTAFELGCQAMGTVPERTVYAGDSIAHDAEGALAAGMIPVWVDRWDDPWEPPEGVHRVESLADLPALLAGL